MSALVPGSSFSAALADARVRLCQETVQCWIPQGSALDLRLLSEGQLPPLQGALVELMESWSPFG